MQPELRKRWILADPIPARVDEALKMYPSFMRQILYNRKISDPIQALRFLEGREESGGPFLLKDMDAAVDRLIFAIDHGEKVAVYGDYDVDGVTATALMVDVLQVLGGQAYPYIPNRFEEGYGLNNDALDSLAEQGVRVVLTVDCGIRSLREAEHANEIGLDLIISDHHHPRGNAPSAEAVICPKQPGDEYPDKNLAGVGLAYKIAQALFERRLVVGCQASDWLDLVALGTVADIVPLIGENRMLVKAGLAQMRLGRRQGLLSLINVAGLNLPGLNAVDISFGLAPRLNASGRLESAMASYELLTTRDLQIIGNLAQKLDDQNRERQKQTQEMQSEAERRIKGADFDRILFAFDKEFNTGVVGLVAAKLTESFYRPAIVGTTGDEFTRASCRSIQEFHITQALDECADLMEHHGGHALAAGFTIRTERLDELVSKLNAIAQRELAELDLRPVLRADLEIPLRDLRPEFLWELERLQPTGAGNPEASFVSRGLKVIRSKAVGQEGKHLKLAVSDGRITYDAIAFGQGRWLEEMPEKIDILYQFEKNVYNGRESLQLRVRDLKPSGSAD
jgi:single-stranded-DNA-specific exonuclease